MSVEDRSAYIHSLTEGVCRVTFTKADGETRVLIGTLKPELLPLPDPTKITESTGQDNLAIVKVYDIENEGWRSFRVDSVIDFGPVTDQ